MKKFETLKELTKKMATFIPLVWSTSLSFNTIPGQNLKGQTRSTTFYVFSTSKFQSKSESNQSLFFNPHKNSINRLLWLNSVALSQLSCCQIQMRKLSKEKKHRETAEKLSKWQISRVFAFWTSSPKSKDSLTKNQPRPAIYWKPICEFLHFIFVLFLSENGSKWPVLQTAKKSADRRRS